MYFDNDNITTRQIKGWTEYYNILALTCISPRATQEMVAWLPRTASTSGPDTSLIPADEGWDGLRYI